MAFRAEDRSRFGADRGSRRPLAGRAPRPGPAGWRVAARREPGRRCVLPQPPGRCAWACVRDAGGGDGFRWRAGAGLAGVRSEEHTSELQSLMRISYAVFCLKKKNITVE